MKNPSKSRENSKSKREPVIGENRVKTGQNEQAEGAPSTVPTVDKVMGVV